MKTLSLQVRGDVRGSRLGLPQFVTGDVRDAPASDLFVPPVVGAETHGDIVWRHAKGFSHSCRRAQPMSIRAFCTRFFRSAVTRGCGLDAVHIRVITSFLLDSDQKVFLISHPRLIRGVNRNHLRGELMARYWFGVSLMLLLASAAPAQNPPQSDPQALSFVSQSITSLGGSTSISDVTLSGTAVWSNGTDTETANATLMAKGTGESRFDMTLNAGPRSEIRNDGSATFRAP
jgi:hypothetical protein